MKRFLTSLPILVAIFCSSSCKKLVDVPAPPNLQTSANVYADDATATAVFAGIYSLLTGASSTVSTNSFASIPIATGLLADELNLFGGQANSNSSLVEYYSNRLLPGAAGTANGSIWYKIYNQIYNVNLAMEGVSRSTNLSPLVRQQLIGEAKFLRAFLYFYIVNLYGDVPLVLSSDYRNNVRLYRSPKDQVLEQIITDLKDAQNNLFENYVGGDSKTYTTERVRPNKWTATALLARVYLYRGRWANAETEATTVINNSLKYDTVSLNNVFLKDSKEAIWQLQPVFTGWNTWDAYVFILPQTGPTGGSSYPLYLSNELVNSFEVGDKRKINWINSVTVGSGATSATYYYPYKYKSATLNAPLTEYTMVLRLAEQYLIRAEARAKQNNVVGAKTDLNVIRTRAGLVNTTANDQTSMLNAILQERKVEFFTEWGHRWLDLKRMGKIDQVMSAYAPTKGTTWSPNWALYPIPLYDIVQNPNLTQNPGY